jgi:putative chitinase
MTINRELFAQECVRQGAFFSVEPHYLLGVAQLRSGISDDSNGDQIGPFRLTQAEWNANSNDDVFELHFTPEQIHSASRQCAVFGLMAERAFDVFEAANKRNPTAKELYLQQWPSAVIDGFQKALDDTAALIGPAADAVLDDPESVAPIPNADQPASGPPPKLDPEPVPVVPAPAGGGGPTLTLDMLNRRWPRATPALRQGIVATASQLGPLGINTSLRMAHFMAQITQETGGGTEMIEKLNYSAAQMRKIFPKRFPDAASTVGFVNNERVFGNKVYNGRMGNRPGSNDGFDFRGRGCLQITGRDSYDAVGKSCGLPLVTTPDLAIDPAHTLLIAAIEFVKLGCLPECDRDNVVQVSARINLGHPTTHPDKIIGLDARKQQLVFWKREFGI